MSRQDAAGDVRR